MGENAGRHELKNQRAKATLAGTRFTGRYSRKGLKSVRACLPTTEAWVVAEGSSLSSGRAKSSPIRRPVTARHKKVGDAVRLLLLLPFGARAPSPKSMSLDIVNGDAVLVSILPLKRCFSSQGAVSPALFWEPLQLFCVSPTWPTSFPWPGKESKGKPCPRFFNIVSLQTYCKGCTLALLGLLMQFHLSDLPMCMRQEPLRMPPHTHFGT